MIKPKLRVLLSFCMAVSLTALAADFWTKKSYPNWSPEETQRMMEDSPWATTLTLGGAQAVAGSNSGYRGEMETSPTISYTMQFRSARPIREAQVRLSQINAHYDKMSAEQKAAFDANASKFLDAAFPDRVLVSVTFHTNVQDYESQLRNYWASQSAAKLNMLVYLNTSQDRLSLVNYGFKEDTFQFTFPRPKQLRPDEKISLEFQHPRIERIGRQRILQEFSVKKMLINGEPAL